MMIQGCGPGSCPLTPKKQSEGPSFSATTHIRAHVLGPFTFTGSRTLNDQATHPTGPAASDGELFFRGRPPTSVTPMQNRQRIRTKKLFFFGLDAKRLSSKFLRKNKSQSPVVGHLTSTDVLTLPVIAPGRGSRHVARRVHFPYFRSGA